MKPPRNHARDTLRTPHDTYQTAQAYGDWVRLQLDAELRDASDAGDLTLQV